MDAEDPGSTPSTPMTPGTPGAPLFGGFRGDKPTTTPRKSLLGNCFTVETWPNEEGSLPAVTCSMTMPPPPVPLFKKVTFFGPHMVERGRTTLISKI